MIDQKIEQFVEEQRRSARGRRLEMLQKPLVGEKKLLSEVLLPTLKSLDGLTKEYEIVSQMGVKIYIDVFYKPLRLAFESMGYVEHAENITRERFSFEQMRVRSITAHGFRHVPFTWDELDKRPDQSRRSVYEILGRFSSSSDLTLDELSVYEREVLRFAVRLNRSLRMDDVQYCLKLGEDACRRVLKKLYSKKLIRPIGGGSIRFHEYVLEEKAGDYML